MRLKGAGKIPDIGDRHRRTQLVALGLQIDDVESQFILLHHPVDAAIASAPQPPRQIAPPCAIAHGQHDIDDEVLEEFGRLRQNPPQKLKAQAVGGALMGVGNAQFFRLAMPARHLRCWRLRRQQSLIPGFHQIGIVDCHATGSAGPNPRKANALSGGAIHLSILTKYCAPAVMELQLWDQELLLLT